VADGSLDRFGFIDPDDGGKARTGIFSAYYKQDLSAGGVFKGDRRSQEGGAPPCASQKRTRAPGQMNGDDVSF
jgi:hypothetical protein